MKNQLTIEDASKRWIQEGLDYKKKLNDWLDLIYIEEKNPETDCPEETRQDLAEFVTEKLIEYNKQNRSAEFRKLFPPDYDPFDWSQMHVACVSQATILNDNRIVATMNQWHQERFVCIIENDQFSYPEDLIMFGKSHDKTFFAKVYADKIEVTEGWDGAVVSTHFPPRDYGLDFKNKYPHLKYELEDSNFEDLRIQSISVASDGSKVYIGCALGIFELNQNESFFFDTENQLENFEESEYEEEEGFGLTRQLDYPHIDISPDHNYVVAGSQSSAHLIYSKSNSTWEVYATVEPRSSYPNLAKFNYKIVDQGYENDGKQVLLCSCHFSRSASLALPINNLKEGLDVSGYNADPELNYIDDAKWVFSTGLYSWGYALGSNDGYIWFRDLYGMQYGYLHAGGTIMDIDYSADRKKMIVATYSGQIIIYDCTEIYGDTLFRSKLFKTENEDRKDPYAITNTAYVDEKRYIFMINEDPMIW